MKYSVIDLETTGANREGQKITEIAIVNYDGEAIESTFSTLINPERHISYSIQKLTGISNEMVQEAPKFYEVAKEIVQMTEGRVIVAHNVFFDYRFLQREFRDLGYVFRREVFCTCKSARVFFPGLMSYSLKNLISHFILVQKNPHRALSDAEDCLKLFELIIKAKENVDQAFFAPTFDHLIPSQLVNFNFNDFPESYGIYFIYDDQNNLLYVGKSHNVRNRLKQHFKTFEGKKREQELKKLVTNVSFLHTYHALPTALAELHYIKTLKPKFNRANRKTRTRFALTVNVKTDEVGEELKVSSYKDETDLFYQFGTKKAAYYEKAKIYTEAFGVNLFTANFKDQLILFKKSFGPDVYLDKILKAYQKRNINLGDRVIEELEWSMTIEENSLKSIVLHRHSKDVEKLKISETPDMRHLLLSLLKKGKYLSQFKGNL